MSVALLQRALPEQRRAVFARRLVASHLDELNGFGDRLRFLTDCEGQKAERERAQVISRCHSTVEALRWNVNEVVALTWEWLARPRANPVDAFGPECLLLKLEGRTERYEGWCADLPAAARAVLPGP